MFGGTARRRGVALRCSLGPWGLGPPGWVRARAQSCAPLCLSWESRCFSTRLFKSAPSKGDAYGRRNAPVRRLPGRRLRGSVGPGGWGSACAGGTPERCPCWVQSHPPCRAHCDPSCRTSGQSPAWWPLQDLLSGRPEAHRGRAQGLADTEWFSWQRSRECPREGRGLLGARVPVCVCARVRPVSLSPPPSLCDLWASVSVCGRTAGKSAFPTA